MVVTDGFVGNHGVFWFHEAFPLPPSLRSPLFLHPNECRYQSR